MEEHPAKDLRDRDRQLIVAILSALTGGLPQLAPRRNKEMSTKRFATLSAISGIVGVVLLITSFIINPGPPSNATDAQLLAFAHQYHDSILLGAWLQAVSPVLIALFALAIVHLAGAATRFAGQVTLTGSVVLVMVSLLEVTFYLSAVNGKLATTGLLSLDLIRAVQHLYSMVAAPLLFFPLATVVLQSRVIPRAFGLVALVLGALFALLGVLVLFRPWQYIVDILSFVQGLWWLFAGIALLFRVRQNPSGLAPLHT